MIRSGDILINIRSGMGFMVEYDEDGNLLLNDIFEGANGLGVELDSTPINEVLADIEKKLANE